jgi:hypothetical protein
MQTLGAEKLERACRAAAQAGTFTVAFNRTVLGHVLHEGIGMSILN